MNSGRKGWFDEDVFSVLGDRGVAEQAEFRCPVVCTASWGYLRLHRPDYDQAALDEWARCVSQQAWTDGYVYFKHDAGAGLGSPAVEAFVSSFPG